MLFNGFYQGCLTGHLTDGGVLVTQLFIIFLSIIAGMFVGLALSNISAKRQGYFDELINLIERLISDIKFSQSPTEKILCSYQCQSANLQKNINEYLDFMRSGSSALSLSKGLLNKREHLLIFGFFERLGTLDLETQLNELEARKEVFKDIRLKTKEKNSKFGKAYIKLGFLSGLLIGILLI